MLRIGLISDTHGHMDDQILQNLEECDEVWHAGDIGKESVIEQLPTNKAHRIVFGNIDHGSLRTQFPKDLSWKCEDINVFMTHIGGYPGRYVKRVQTILDETKPRLYICGHSHILKVLLDKKRDIIHMNPGACGYHGFHNIRTMLRFSVTGDQIHDLEAIELGLRGKKPKLSS